MTTKRVIDVNTAARADGKVPAWDTASATHLYVSPSSVSSTTAPTFVGIGSSASGIGDITPTLPAGHATNDILLLFVQSSNQAASAPAGYAQLGPATGQGTAAAASSTRLTIFWKRDTGAESDPTVTDTGDHTLAQIMAIRGCPTSGDPFISIGQNRKTTASTTGTAVAGGTGADNCLIVSAFAHALDSASAVFSAWTNASLASITERIDVATADGNGGGIGVATGVLVTAGSLAATTVTETSTVDVSSTFAMLPADAINVARAPHVDVQTFVTAGITDTWTKPAGAKIVEMVAIGGGASGSAGRNAATAAGGGGGGGGSWATNTYLASDLPATLTVEVGAGGAATANSDGAASNAGATSRVSNAGSARLVAGFGGVAAGVSATGSGGLGGNGGSRVDSPPAVGVVAWGLQGGSGGTGGTTAAAGGAAEDGGGGGAGGGTTQANSAGGASMNGGGGGGGGRSNTNIGLGGGSRNSSIAGGQTAGANGTDGFFTNGGGGGAGGNSATGPGGQGGWPGGGGGGGGTVSGQQRGGAGGDGAVVIITYC